MRYPDGGGLTAAERARREQVRLAAADTRRLADCFAAVDYFEHRATPFLVAVNCFDGAPGYRPEDVRIALDLDQDTPVVLCDARQRESVKKVLIALFRHAIANASASSVRH
jgi:signal recognition particle receptor subunit beta